jgi:glycosyltransferase involved in cell wall biosynthesis
MWKPSNVWVKGNMVPDQALTIVHTEASRSWGGQGIRILHESLWMREHGHRLIIVAPAASGLLQEAQRVGLETYAMPFTKRTQARDLVQLARYVRRLRPDVLNTHSSVDTWVGCLAGNLCRVPAIIRTRHFGVPVRPHLLNRWLYTSLCHQVFTTSDGIARALIADLGLPARKVAAIPTGIKPPEVLPCREAARSAFIQEFGLPLATRFIGCLAVLRQGKGHAVLIEAFRAIQDAIPHHHLLIIGEGSARPRLEALIQACGLQQRVHLTGYRSDPWFVLRALDVHVLTSTSHEGTPQAILQAQFAACPVIGSDSMGITEVITHEHTGLLVPRGEAAPLSKALLRVLAYPEYAARLARQAKQYVQTHHTLDLMGTKILHVYQRLLQRR